MSVLLYAFYAESPYYVVLSMQSLLIMQCFLCKVSLLCSAFYAECPYYVVLSMQSKGRGSTGRAVALQLVLVLAVMCLLGLNP